jgi:azurin
MTRLKLAGVAALMLAGRLAYATDGCVLTIEGNDLMQYNLREISVPTACTEIEVTLKHSGKLQAKVMGHDWVLAKSSDVSGVLNSAMAAGAARGYLPEGDKRIIAATKLVGGGESTTTKFSTAALHDGESYTFFCTTPGHATVMRGKFVFGDTKRVARAEK